ncbi:MAG TPA: GAF domain-containing protein, partial [Candidatus Limnocylindria bacterium]
MRLSRRRDVVAALALLLFVAAFVPQYRSISPIVVSLLLVPVAAIAWTVGRRGGMRGALVASVVTVALLWLVGQPVDVDGLVPSYLALVLVGGLVGRLADLRRVTERELTAVARRRREADALADAARLISEHSLDESLVERILEAAQGVLPSAYFALLLVTDDGAKLEIEADLGGRTHRGQRFSVSEGVTGRAFRSRACQLVGDTRLDPDYVAGAFGGDDDPNGVVVPAASSALAAPIEGHGRCLGVLYLEDPRPDRFGEHDAELLQAFSRYAAIALESLAAARAIRASEERFARYFRSHPIPGFITRVGDSRIIDVNEDLCALSGYSRDELIGRTSLELGLWVDPTDLERRQMRTARDGFIRDWE